MDYLMHRATTDSSSLDIELTKNETGFSVASHDNEKTKNSESFNINTNSYAKYIENSSLPDEKSRSTTSMFEVDQVSGIGQHIDQVDEDHYRFRRGSTEIHVQTYAASSASDVMEDSCEVSFLFSAMRLFSILLGIIIIMITLAIKITSSITDRLNYTVGSGYLLSLLTSSFIWTTYYTIKGRCKSGLQIKFSKSNQSSNRWLKGVLFLFGLAIVLKDGLELLAFVSVDLSECTQTRMNVALSVLNILFVISQVKYLFCFRKVYIRNYNAGSRTGLMYLIAVNLSMWIISIIDETLVALDGEAIVEETHNKEDSTTADFLTIVSNYTVYQTTSNYKSVEDHHADSCICHSSFCETVHLAEQFLFPFVVEFSLVASSLLYITWSNIGKRPPPCERVVKPSYKLYNSYAGLFFGCLVFFATIIIIILLGTTNSGLPQHERNYFTEAQQLVMYNSFLIALESFMLLGCFIGFYFFQRIRRPLESAAMLDNVLLIICILGPLGSNIFSMIAAIVGPDNRIYEWSLTVVVPLCDVLQSLSQLVLIIYGLKREPIISSRSKQTAEDLKRGIHEHRNRENIGFEHDIQASTFENKTYLRSRRNSITSVVSRLALAKFNPPSDLHAESESIDDNLQKSETTSHNNILLAPKIVITSEKDSSIIAEKENKEDVEMKNVTFNVDNLPSSNLQDIEAKQSQSILKIVSETKVASPDVLRLRLRDTLLFLLVCNATLWMFMSLDGTAFTVYPYQSSFYGDSSWTVISMVFRPLSIFFRMHSAACLFEMWSFA